MDDRFTRTEALLGTDAIERLRSAKVAVFGLGGVGSYITEALAGKVKSVSLSGSLGSHAVSVRPEGGVSFEMEKYFSRVNPEMAIKADRVLELNPEHPAFAALKAAKENDPEKAKKYAELLYNQAMLIADMPIEDPTAFADLICSLMI